MESKFQRRRAGRWTHDHGADNAFEGPFPLTSELLQFTVAPTGSNAAGGLFQLLRPFQYFGGSPFGLNHKIAQD